LLEGVYVANVTPFGENPPYPVDTGAYLEHVSWLCEKGVRGIVPMGTNGEGTAVSLDEKLGVFGELFARGFAIEIVPTVMEGNLPDTLKMVENLNGFPATAVLVLPPYYVKPVTAEGLKRFYEPVLEASDHPIVVYHIPKYAVNVPEEVVAALPVWGVKDSGSDPDYSKSVLGVGKGVLIGTEDDLWKNLNLGAQGVISALANFVPEAVLKVYEKAKAGDATSGRPLSEGLKRVRAMTKEYASPAVLKKLAQARHGTPMGTVRPPFVPAPDGYDPAPVLELARTIHG
jgi:dihydrodipicolinate synthase/N-acetylneuraminate lyase